MEIIVGLILLDYSINKQFFRNAFNQTLALDRFAFVLMQLRRYQNKW